jgi:hypothetical protein
MKRLVAVMLMSLVLLAGCHMRLTNGDIKPIYPDLGYTDRPKTIDTLTPTFRWTSEAKAPSTYDFAIWDSGEVIDGNMGSKRPIYYKEALPQPEHKIEIPLAPNTVYAWSVRTRSEGKASPWMTYNSHTLVLGTYMAITNGLYRFKTPLQ